MSTQYPCRRQNQLGTHKHLYDQVKKALPVSTSTISTTSRFAVRYTGFRSAVNAFCSLPATYPLPHESHSLHFRSHMDKACLLSALARWISWCPAHAGCCESGRSLITASGLCGYGTDGFVKASQPVHTDNQDFPDPTVVIAISNKTDTALTRLTRPIKTTTRFLWETRALL